MDANLRRDLADAFLDADFVLLSVILVRDVALPKVRGILTRIGP